MAPDLSRAVETTLTAALGQGVHISQRTPLSGGDISRVERIVTSAGVFVLKSQRAHIPALFRAEADGLTALRGSGTSLRVPRVIVCADADPSFLVIEDLGCGRPGTDFDERVGRGLAALHRARMTRYGFTRDGFCGATTQPNPWRDRWIDFYRDARLGHQVSLARSAGLLSVEDARQFERLLTRLSALLDEPPEGPALIHGDLWSGNLLVADDGAPALVDPAAYFAHREAELGMMTLFGAFSSRVYDAYAESYPLAAGWRDRNPLYQLYHLMNHLNLFGTGYRRQVMQIVERYA
jgi:fructosamine-3-kinase